MASGLSISFLKTELINDVKSAVRAEVTRTAKKVLMDAVNKQIYSSQGGSEYIRTGDFLNAVRIKDYNESSTMVTFTVWVDGSLLRPVRTNGMWNQHMDMKGNPFNEQLVMVMNDGAGANHIYQQPAHYFYEEAEENMDEKILHALVRGLTARGWSVSYT